ncbi:hypothetical protein BASA50_001024 [Batrachochytrium salamandrivorans]|uniref:Uncharacterized protein n=1 Tax=Batrachochytrium salamandrivorans TaxID=1357716 RepID=A0ABQ8ES45_9FUNG|nr:hypothetical protein BASA50_001024 [Batrachochytrium salamandrivorans]
MSITHVFTFASAFFGSIITAMVIFGRSWSNQVSQVTVNLDRTRIALFFTWGLIVSTLMLLVHCLPIALKCSRNRRKCASLSDNSSYFGFTTIRGYTISPTIAKIAIDSTLFVIG